MASATKTANPVQDATARAQELNERLVDASKKVAAEYLDLTETGAQTIVSLQRQVAEQTDIEWVASLADAHARLTGDVSKVLISTARDLLK
jgi:hypothetical protein